MGGAALEQRVERDSDYNCAPVVAPVPRQRVNMAKARRLVAELDKELKRAVDHMEPTRKSGRGTPGKVTPRS